MSKIIIDFLEDEEDSARDDLFTYIVDGGLEDQLIDFLSNDKRIVELLFNSNEKKLSFKVTTIEIIKSKSEILNTDSLLSVDATIDNELLILELKYGGGCKKHKFDLVWDGKYLKSNPPQVNLILKHSNENDDCKGMQEKRIAFTLNNLSHCIINLYVNDKCTQSLEYKK